jgi:hypothetical protein
MHRRSLVELVRLTLDDEWHGSLRQDASVADNGGAHLA